MKGIYDVVIVGAGPSGIGVAAILKQMNASCLILEKDDVGASFQSWPEEMRFITPSFPAQGFGQTDLNAIVPKTSPAYTLDMEHPTGPAYAKYLEVVANHFAISIKKGVQVNHIDKKDTVFSINTSDGIYQSRYVVWAGGEYQFPDVTPFPGADLGIHNSMISSWQELDGDDFLIIGGYESGMDAAYQLGQLGKKTRVIARTNTWEVESSDPSIALSTYTYNRVRPLFDAGLLTVTGNTTVAKIEENSSGYDVYTKDGKVYFTKARPILATGFTGSTKQIENLVSRGKHNEVLVNEQDESTAVSGLFLAGPELRHGSHIFCYIYKFRQRFAVIAETIGRQLDLDLSILEEYRQENFYLDDLSMCGGDVPMLEQAQAFSLTQEEVVLIGSESVGKSGLFRALTGEKSAVARNVKGSTIAALKASCQLHPDVRLTDLPGLQFDMDSQNTQLTLDHFQDDKTILLVVKATNLKEELTELQDELNLKGKRIAVVATHRDKYLPPESEQNRIKELVQVPVIWVNTRKMDEQDQEAVIAGVKQAEVWGASKSILSFLPDSGDTANQLIPAFRMPIAGPILACFFILGMFAVPVMGAYLFVSWLEPIADQYVLDPITGWINQAPSFLAEVLTGDYGLITLGSYSFLWAFPVVLLISVMTSLTEETGIQEHVTRALDPWLRKIGLTGRDLLPVITGFGCNVVAVFQSRGCSSCTRTSCVSLIAFGSACSYQIGATLSIFSAAHVPLLFIPYLFILFIVGAIHTRIWNRNEADNLTRIAPLPYIQKINWQAFAWKVASSVKQFLLQAMPIFLIICLAASVLQAMNILSLLHWLAMPILYLFSLPVDAAPGLIFSFIRKDGLLILNEGQGSLLMEMPLSQIFILVYLASTLSACLVTLFTIGKELGWRTSLSIGGKQMLTSVVSAAILAGGLHFIF